MWLISALLVAGMAMVPSTAAVAAHSACPATHGAVDRPLVNARLFDGPVTDQVELVPDDPSRGTWDVSGYRHTGRILHWLCEYRGGGTVVVQVDAHATRCRFRGKTPASAACR